MIVAALLGNQNSGKTTLYNRLTGGKRKTGNFPGVTVDVGSAPLIGYKDITIADLPGIYSLSPFTDEETVTRDFIFDKAPDVIINILDATSFVRNMYLTLQLLEANKPVIIVLNMMDEVKASGASIDTERMSRLLNAPVIPASAAIGDGIEALIKAIASYVLPSPLFPSLYGGKTLEFIKKIAAISGFSLGAAAAFIAQENKNPPTVNQTVLEREIKAMEAELNLDREAAIADMRYTAAEKLYKLCVKEGAKKKASSLTERLDKVLTHKYLALPIFFIVMAAVFYFTFAIFGESTSALFEKLTALGIEKARIYLLSQGVRAPLVSFVTDGILGGLGSVLSFLPMITALFFFLSLIEDTGYMARVAFVTDRLLIKIGLSGRSIVPALIGFGCSVPAYMSLRTIPSKRDKRLSALLIPFMPCSAKVPVFALFTAVFFQNNRVLVMLFLYALNIGLGILYALILKKTAFKGEPQPFIIELPTYRLPSLSSTASFLWDKVKGFFSRAFSVILLTSVVIWFLRSFDAKFTYISNPAGSLLADMARLIAPLFTPLGFNDWRAATAIITGLAAKEAVVSTFAVLLGGGANLFAALRELFAPLEALSFLVFCSLYVPCTAALAAFSKEIKSPRFAFFSMAAQTAIAYLAALIFYTSGRLIVFLSG